MSLFAGMFLLMSGALTIGSYFFSPFIAAHKLTYALYHQDTATLKRIIPPRLLTHWVVNPHYDQHWQGAGHTYLSHVWPKLFVEIDRYDWLSLEVQILKHWSAHSRYHQGLNQLYTEIGQGHETIRFEWHRQGLLHWQVLKMCYPSPQPDRVMNRCPSSSR